MEDLIKISITPLRITISGLLFSAKSFNFDENGNEPDIDYDRLLRIVADSGYSGYLGIEYEGNSLSEYDGIHATIKLLRRVIADMS